MHYLGLLPIFVMVVGLLLEHFYFTNMIIPSAIAFVIMLAVVYILDL